MENSIDSISIIKEENTNQNNYNFNSNIRLMKEDELNFEKSLEISKIENKEEQIKQKNGNEDNNNINMNDISDYSFITDNEIINNKKKTNKNKITKEELNNIPLPIFSCIYCCNEKISFNHLSNEIISNKYLFQTSIYDLKQLDILITGKRSQKEEENKLINIVINNFENLKAFYNKKESRYIFGTNKYGITCKKNEAIIKKRFRMKLEEQLNKKKKEFYFKEIKGMYKITKNSLNNKCLFNSNSIINNYSSLAGLIPAGETMQNIIEKKNNSINSSRISNLNMQGNNPLPWKKNEIGLIGKDNNKHYVENIIEKIDKNGESDILDFLGENDLKRKINRKDIEWEETYYDINKPKIDDDIINTSIDMEENFLNYSNNNKINKNRNNMNIIIEKQKNINNNSKHISINSENKSHLKLSIFNNSKSLASTNTSSNIIQKNKENRSLSIFLNKNFNIGNNSSPRNNNIIIKNIRNNRKLLKERELNSPSISKKRIIDFDTKSYKKIFGIGNVLLDSKNIHKKILFNHTVNIKKDIKEYKNIYNKHIDINIKDDTKNIFFMNNINHNKININKENINNKSYNKLIYNNNNDNDKNINIENNITFFDKMIKRFKSNKDSNKKRSIFNPIFKFNKNNEKPQMKSPPINNIKYSLILPQNKDKKLNLLNFNKNSIIIKSLENDYINNFVSTNMCKKENNLLERKMITENNYKENNINQNRNFNYLKNGIRIIS